MQTSITRAQFRKDLAGSLWVDGVQSSCFFPLCRTVKASEKMGQRRVAKSPAVPYEPLCDFLCFYAPRKNPLPPRRERAKSRDLGVNGAFYRGHYRKLDYFASMELVQNCFKTVIIFVERNYPTIIGIFHLYSCFYLFRYIFENFFSQRLTWRHFNNYSCR